MDKDNVEKLEIKYKRKDYIFTMIKGAIVGGTMLVPGVSGGSMAMILGIYNRLIASVSSFLKNIKDNFIFLGLFAAGAVAGLVILSHPLLYLMENCNRPFMYFFIGAVAGSIPMVYRQAKIRERTLQSVLKQLIYLVIGMSVVVLFAIVPEDAFTGAGLNPRDNIVLQLFTGVIAAVALVLPGISVSYMLVLMGIYDTTVAAISRLDILYLMPIALGLFLGIVLVTKLLESAMEKHPEPTYIIIIGFMIGSVVQVFPGLPNDVVEWLLSACLAIVGFNVILSISGNELKS